jgi:hypothetical protein
MDEENAQLDDAVKEANEKMGHGDCSGIMNMIVGVMLDPATGCNFDARGEVHNELVGLPIESLDDVVQRVVDGFRK